MKKVLVSLISCMFIISSQAFAGEYLDKACEYMQNLQQYEEAEKWFDLAMENEEDTETILIYRSSNYIYLKKYRESIADCQKYLEIATFTVNNSIMIDQMGKCYYELGEYDTAIEKFSSIIISKKYDPNNMWYLYFDRAKAYDKKNLKIEALADCNEAIRLIEAGFCYNYVHKKEIIEPLYKMRDALNFDLGSSKK